MKLLKAVPLICALVFCLSAGTAQAKADSVALYTEAVMTGDIPALEALLAPNYWHIGANGHIEDFGESVLILDIDEFGSSILDDQDGTWGQFTGHSTAAVALLVTLESPCSYAEGNIHQRKDDRISDMDRISDNCLGRNKCIHSFKKRIYSILKIVFT